ncbi:hypothetical protein ACP4OV_007423 [Aristida adscensionis]
MEEVNVLIVGFGPAGLATAACLSRHSIPYLIVEREDCSASLWRNRAYDRLKLHLAKEFCALPYIPFPKDAPTYIPRQEFVKYMDCYAKHFDIHPKYHNVVKSATYNEKSSCWTVVTCDTVTSVEIRYAVRFLVVATGVNGVGNIPEISGLESFPGDVMHSSTYKNGRSYVGKRVLVVGSGNSGMDIAYDLSNHGADASIVVVVRSQVHIMTKELMRLGMTLAQYMPISIVDTLLVTLAEAKFGDISKHGIERPKIGPLLLKSKTGRSSVIDVGTVDLIKKGAIKVLGVVSKIVGNKVKFEGGVESYFDAILFATGYKSTVNTWLKLWI